LTQHPKINISDAKTAERRCWGWGEKKIAPDAIEIKKENMIKEQL
jgi:hypothetical protein